MIYRPRLNDGKLVATKDVIYTHDFFYRPSDIPATPTASTSTPVVEETNRQPPSNDDES